MTHVAHGIARAAQRQGDLAHAMPIGQAPTDLLKTLNGDMPSPREQQGR